MTKGSSYQKKHKNEETKPTTATLHNMHEFNWESEFEEELSLIV